MKEWITGRNPVYEVLRSGRRQVFKLMVAGAAEEKGRIADIIQLAGQRRIKVDKVQRQQLDAVIPPEARSTESHQGVAIQVSGYQYADLQDVLERADERQEPLLILMLDMIQNPQNLGTLLRTAEALGVHGVIMPLARAAGITPAVVHASVGASEHLLVVQANLAQVIDELQKKDVWVVGLEGGESAQPVAQVRLDGPLALVVGNEGEGIRPLVAKRCDVLLRLPMHGKIESFNAAVAGSIALYLARQTRA